jgi:hypothetical protein
VAGIGEKTAVELLKAYGSLDGVYENLWQIKGALAKKLESGKDMAYLSKRLVDLMTDAPVPLDLKHMDMSNLDTRAVEDMLKKLEFRSLVRQLPDVMRSVEDQVHAGLLDKPHNRERGLDMPEVNKSIDSEEASVIIIHARYDGTSSKLADLALVANNKAVMVPVEHLATKSEMIRHLCEGAVVVGYDLKRLIKCLADYQISLDFTRVFDVQIAAFMLNSLLRDQSIAGLAREYLDLELEYDADMPDKQLLYECASLAKLHTLFKRGVR